MMESKKTIDEELDDWARAKGFESHREMAARLEAGQVRLSRGQSRRYLKELEPVVDQGALAAAKASVDSTGLPEVADFVRSIARLIRVLLLGYTSAECEFVQSRSMGLVLLADTQSNTRQAREERVTEIVDGPPADESARHPRIGRVRA
jgi:hypothetical protein